MSSKFPYKKILDYLREGICCGDFPAGKRIPSQKELCVTFGVSRAPVLKALAILTQEGLLSPVQGSGMFVADRSRPSAAGKGEIALVIPVASEYYTEFVNALQDAVFAAGYLLRIYTTGYNEEVERAVLRQLAGDRNASGIIFSPQGNARKMAEFYPGLLRRTGKPVILVNRRIPGSDLDYLEYDYEQGGRMLAGYLLELGLTRMIFHGADPRRNSWEPRLRGLQQGYRERNISAPVLQLPATLGPVHMRRLAELFKAGKVDVIVSADDRFVGELCHLLEALCIRVPDDIALAGFDNLECASYIDPPLTTVAPAKAEAARLAAEHMVRKFHDPGHQVRLSLPCTLIERASCRHTDAAERVYPFQKTPPTADIAGV